MNEPNVLMSDPLVMISETIIRIGPRTFATPNVTSVEVRAGGRGDRIAIGVLLVVLGFLCLSLGAYVWGALFMLASAPCFYFVPDCTLVLVTASGEVQALNAKEARCISVRGAVIEAMHRHAASRMQGTG